MEDAAELRVTRDCELFKALNNHYNKTNEFEVIIPAIPDSFLSHTFVATRSSSRQFEESSYSQPKRVRKNETAGSEYKIIIIS